MPDTTTSKTSQKTDTKLKTEEKPTTETPQKTEAKTPTIIDLDTCVLNALELFEHTSLPPVDTRHFSKPLIIGSGNALVAGKIIFSDADASFADESTYQTALKIHKPDGVVLISASGGKSAPPIAQQVRKMKLPCVLWTNNREAPAIPLVDETKFFPKNAEPYTYNTSTYMGMILSKTKESPAKIREYIDTHIKPIIPSLRTYDAYYLIVPEKFDAIREMFLTKFDELFGPRISGRCFTPGQTMHAKTVVGSEKEFFISFGEKTTLGSARLHVPLPPWAGYAAIMAVGYYIIGQIQKQNPPYFKQSISAYTAKASKEFGQTIKVIVD